MAISLQWIVLLLKFKGVFGLFCLRRNTAKMYFQEISVKKKKLWKMIGDQEL